MYNRLYPKQRPFKKLYLTLNNSIVVEGQLSRKTKAYSSHSICFSLSLCYSLYIRTHQPIEVEIKLITSGKSRKNN